jgi:hypothetical protein
MEMLPDTSKFEIKLRALPPLFARFNRTFPIRNEGLAFLAEIVNNRDLCSTIFYGLGRLVESVSLFARERETLTRVGNDPDFRRGTVRLLTILNEMPPKFCLWDMICRSELLIALKDEELNDWDNFQMLRNAWRKTDPKPPSTRTHAMFRLL